uniref:ATP synthase-coupling factor 6, mitochondrial n=1 Tax=Steinernema glaseri TaxID=37863 RepID=A0A1I7ZR14_9BILA
MLRRGVVVSCRTFSTSRAQMKEADLIAKAFVNKIREYGQKNTGGNLISSSPEAAKQLNDQLNRLAQKFQLASADVVAKLPLKFQEAKVESSVDALLEGKDLAELTASVKQSHESYKKERAAKLQAEKERQLALNEAQNATQATKSV